MIGNLWATKEQHEPKKISRDDIKKMHLILTRMSLQSSKEADVLDTAFMFWR